MSRMRVLSPALVMTVLLVAGCASPPLSREGATADPVTLTSLWGNGPGGVGADVLDAITTSQVAPEITVTAEDENAREDTDDHEGQTITLLQSGGADVSVLRADRLVMAGATSLAPLTAPMTVFGPDHAAAIASAPVADELMAGLDELGLVGIALAPGGTRRLFGYHDPVVEVQDFTGAVFNTRPGSGVEAIFDALGASTEHSIGDERTERAASGALRGIEVSLQQVGAVDLPAVMTTNIDLYTKFDVVVVTQEAWDALSTGQQTAFRAKVQDGIATATSQRLSDADALTTWCGTPGATTAVATTTERAGIEDALQGVRDELEVEPGMADLFVAIDTLAPADRPARLQSCEQITIDDIYTVRPVGDQTVLDGTWRLQIDQQTLLDAGVPRSEAAQEAGTWTYTIENGRAVAVPPFGEDCTHQFSFDGDRFSLDYEAEGDNDCYGLSAGTYRVEGGRVYFDFDAARDNPPEWDDAIWANGMVKIADD